MNLLLDFFAIRPVFTLYGLRVLWGAYLIDQALPFVTIFTNPNISVAAAGPIIALFLRACLNAIIFRLLLEIAASVLSGRPSSPH